METGERLRLLDDEIQEIPLRHQSDEFAMRGHVREIGDHHSFVANLAGKLKNLLMRALEELVENAKLVHQFERGRVNRITAKVAQEILVLFEHDYIKARPREQKAQHHSGGASSGNAAACEESFGHCDLPATRANRAQNSTIRASDQNLSSREPEMNAQCPPWGVDSSSMHGLLDVTAFAMDENGTKGSSSAAMIRVGRAIRERNWAALERS
jgi:hypothetical protein